MNWTMTLAGLTRTPSTSTWGVPRWLRAQPPSASTHSWSTGASAVPPPTSTCTPRAGVPPAGAAPASRYLRIGGGRRVGGASAELDGHAAAGGGAGRVGAGLAVLEDRRGRLHALRSEGVEDLSGGGQVVGGHAVGQPVVAAVAVVGAPDGDQVR